MTIKLEGYIKTQDVINGYAGLILNVHDKNGKTLVYNSMEFEKITGTKDWEKYTIILPYPAKAENIYVAGVLSGEGEVWFDKFTVSIGGKDIQMTEELENHNNQLKELTYSQLWYDILTCEEDYFILKGGA